MYYDNATIKEGKKQHNKRESCYVRREEKVRERSKKSIIMKSGFEG